MASVHRFAPVDVYKWRCIGCNLFLDECSQAFSKRVVSPCSCQSQPFRPRLHLFGRSESTMAPPWWDYGQCIRRTSTLFTVACRIALPVGLMPLHCSASLLTHVALLLCPWALLTESDFYRASFLQIIASILGQHFWRAILYRTFFLKSQCLSSTLTLTRARKKKYIIADTQFRSHLLQSPMRTPRARRGIRWTPLSLDNLSLLSPRRSIRLITSMMGETWSAFTSTCLAAFLSPWLGSL